MKAMSVVLYVAIPSHGPSDPLWQQPFNAASLFVPSVLDSCFVLLDKLSTSPGSSGGGSSSFGSGMSVGELVCALG
jgi:hypothetical protein